MTSYHIIEERDCKIFLVKLSASWYAQWTVSPNYDTYSYAQLKGGQQTN